MNACPEGVRTVRMADPLLQGILDGDVTLASRMSADTSYAVTSYGQGTEHDITGEWTSEQDPENLPKLIN